MRRRLPSSLAVAASAVACGLLLPTPAAAHVEPEVTTVPAGSTAEVQFTVEHGCDGSPTVKLEFQVPDGITDAQPIEEAGWTGSVVDGVVTYTGGSLPDDQQADFGIRFTVPGTVGDTIRFPMIQTCEEGQLDWIQDGEDAERPAPAVEVGEPDPNATTVPVPAETTTTAAAASTTVAPTTAAPSTTSATPAATPTTADDEDDDGSGALVLSLIAAIVVVLGGGGFLAYRMRRDQTSSS